MLEKEIYINGLKVNYKIAGQGQPILILHGWGGASDSWTQVQKILANQGHRVIVPDLPGFGKSDLPQVPWSLDEYLNWFSNFVQNLNFNHFFLLGHSFGGRIAIKFSAKYPEKILGLILSSAAGIKHKKTLWQLFLFALARMGRRLPFLSGYSLFRKTFYRFIVRKKDYFEAKGVMKETFKKIIEEDLTPYLSQISLSTLILWSQIDKMTPLSDAYLMKEKIKNSRLEILEKRGHSLHLKNPELLCQKILSFSKLH